MTFYFFQMITTENLKLCPLFLSHSNDVPFVFLNKTKVKILKSIILSQYAVCDVRSKHTAVSLNKECLD